MVADFRFGRLAASGMPGRGQQGLYLAAKPGGEADSSRIFVGGLSSRVSATFCLRRRMFMLLGGRRRGAMFLARVMCLARVMRGVPAGGSLGL